MTKWLSYSLLYMFFGGVAGALSEFPEINGFPGTLSYVVWAIVMVIPAVIILKKEGWNVNRSGRDIFYGMIIGLCASVGMIFFFKALSSGPAYLIFPIISLSPAVAVILSLVFLKERTNVSGWIGIFFAFLSIALFSYFGSGDGDETRYGSEWLFYAIAICLMWGGQSFMLKKAGETMNTSSTFFYMTFSGLICIPWAISITDFSQVINYSLDGVGYSILVQSFSAIAMIGLISAFKYGKAIIVASIVNALTPAFTVILSLIIYQSMPSPTVAAGIIFAIVAAAFLIKAENASEEDEGKETEVHEEANNV